jgi:protocatechuate 3,4-dioxygenase beta subunit
MVLKYLKRSSFSLILLGIIFGMLFLNIDIAFARLTVKGTITYETDGTPVEGALVEAWDADIGYDDYMGDDKTNSNGYYEINYADGHWDPAPHRITTWRPDIYIKVDLDGNFVEKSSTKSNHPHRNDLTKNLAINSPGVIYGRITHANGTPAYNVRVEAFDADWHSGDDIMGSVFTDSNGEYRIQYDLKHWDPALHSTGWWRPDIYIKISKSGFIPIEYSSEHVNHRLRDDLRIDKAIDIHPDRVKISAVLMYEEADAEEDAVLTTRGYKPIRYAHIRLRKVGSDEYYRTISERDGSFHFVVLREAGARYKLVVRPRNWVAKVYRDLDDCNEEVWWRTKFNIPEFGDLNLGELRVGTSSSSGLEGFWRETDGNLATDIFCGGSRHDISGGSAYFNIAETILVGWAYANGNRDDTDSIGQVDVTYPSPGKTTTSYHSTWGEIYLTKPHQAEDNRDFGFFDHAILHEYVHHLQSDISENDWSFTENEDVCDDGPGSEPAFAQGFAEYLAVVIANKHRTGTQFLSQDIDRADYYETPMRCSGAAGEDTPSGVGSVLWDLVDAPVPDYPYSISEPFDTASGEDQIIFNILDKELDNLVDAPDLCEFEDAWRDRLSGAREQAIDPILEEYNVDCG